MASFSGLERARMRALFAAAQHIDVNAKISVTVECVNSSILWALLMIVTDNYQYVCLSHNSSEDFDLECLWRVVSYLLGRKVEHLDVQKKVVTYWHSIASMPLQKHIVSLPLSQFPEFGSIGSLDVRHILERILKRRIFP